MKCDPLTNDWNRSMKTDDTTIPHDGHNLAIAPDAVAANPSVTRRQALSGLAFGTAAALPGLLPTPILGRDGTKAPGDKIAIGVIGFGPRCTYVMNAMLGLPDVRCVAIADVQKSRRESGKALVDKLSGNTDCVTYGDMRKLLERKDIDAVVVATGDRWHTPASILAAEAGKDVYCEKPCGLSIKNVQDLAAVMKKTGRVFQAGTQRRSMPLFQKAVELARGGKLGKLDTLYASVYMPELGNNWLPGEPTPAADVCDWNLWLGLAPWRPYNAAYVAGKWRNQFDFESGAANRLGCPHCRSVPVGQRCRQDHTRRVHSGEDQHHLSLRERREAGPHLPENTLWRSRPDLQQHGRRLPGEVRGQ
jgi:hypothetical protein